MALAQLVQSAKSALGIGAGKPKNEIPPSDVEIRPERESTASFDPLLLQTFISSRWTQIREAFMTYHQLIWRAILFYVGQTWIEWDPYRKYYTPAVPEDEYSPQPRINRYSPAIDAVASNFNQIPGVQATARDADGDEQYRRHGIAQVATKLAKDLLLRTGLKSDFQSRDNRPTAAAMQFVLCGGLFTSLRVVTKPPVQSVLGPIEEKLIDCDIVDNMFVLPRPGSPDFGGVSGTPYIAVARRMTLEEAYTRFQIDCDPDQEYVDGYMSTFETTLNYYYTGFNALSMNNEDSCLITEWYIPPSGPNHPGVKEVRQTGAYAVWANDKLKFADDWTFPEHPLTKFDYIRVPRLFFARSVAFDLCDLQEELQQYEAIIKLHAMTNAVSPWVVDANTLVGEITGRADKVVKYRSLGPGAIPPKREAAGTLDQGVYAKLQQIKEEFENVSGAASVFRGRQEGAVTAGTAIAQLRGQAQLMFSMPNANWVNGWKETVRKGVKFMQANYTAQQVSQIVGDDLNSAVGDFMQEQDLDNVIDWVASSSGAAMTDDDLKAEMMQMYDRGALDLGQVDVRERLFELFGETGMMQTFNLDATRARMENKGMKQAPPIPPTFMPEIEDLNVHLGIHAQAIKSLEFDRLQPPSKQMLMTHYMETKQALVMMQQAMAAQAPPKPGDKPGLAEQAGKGKPTTSPAIPHSQGTQPIGASHGAPPSSPPGPTVQ